MDFNQIEIVFSCCVLIKLAYNTKLHINIVFDSKLEKTLSAERSNSNPEILGSNLGQSSAKIDSLK